MKFNDFLAKLEEFEGYKNVAYKCPAGVWTIGFGRTQNVKEGDKTDRKAEELWLIAELQKLSERIRNYCYEVCDYGWVSEDVLYALTDFTFNCGFENFTKLVQNGTRTLEDVANSIVLYNKANGKVLKGLTKRRKWEQELIRNACGGKNADICFKHRVEGWCRWTGKCQNNYAVCVNSKGVTIKIAEADIMSHEIAIQFVGKKEDK